METPVEFNLRPATAANKDGGNEKRILGKNAIVHIVDKLFFFFLLLLLRDLDD